MESKANRRAGTGKDKSYKNMSAESRARKLAYDKKYQQKPEQMKLRADRNRQRAKAIKAGKVKVGERKDYDHATKKIVSEKVNRGRTSKNSPKFTAGDKRARG